jgi:hypothetical protein
MFKLFEGENAKPSVNVIKNPGEPLNYCDHSHLAAGFLSLLVV